VIEKLIKNDMIDTLKKIQAPSLLYNCTMLKKYLLLEQSSASRSGNVLRRNKKTIFS
jgi:hypothetical protein